jgi:hypothetical protein
VEFDLLPPTSPVMNRKALHSLNGDTFNLKLFPEKPDFGVICRGFEYKMTISVTNCGLRPERLRVFCYPKSGNNNRMGCTYAPIQLAPGISTDVYITITAANLEISSCDLRVIQATGQLEHTWTIDATVSPVDVFKSVTQYLKLHNKPMYKDRVKATGQISTKNVYEAAEELAAEITANEEAEGSSVVEGDSQTMTGGHTLFSDAFMEEGEIEDLADIPRVPNVYFDPWSKELKIDPVLTSVVVGADMTVQESIEATQKRYMERNARLEDKGMFTCSSLAALAGTPGGSIGGIGPDGGHGVDDKIPGQK